MSKIVIFTDGGARGNPGPAAAGIVVFDGTEKLFEFGKYLGPVQTNNWAEYEAVILALESLRERGLVGREIEVRMDSKLCVEQISGNWKIKEPTLKTQVARVHALLKDFPQYKFIHIPRAENSEADAQVNQALDAQL